ncbi:hypothetical protein H4R34_001525 [Dimargaris verticillata]|uniref:Uncharacterized protein n=1 Tax=Dimargaris verticillata TaxID=2761393 RepID=A0A9W8B4I2_9FUNG|nr:hypothetical protein H4R34_001525 [Dimargaris verticillata]
MSGPIKVLNGLHYVTVSALVGLTGYTSLRSRISEAKQYAEEVRRQEAAAEQQARQLDQTLNSKDLPTAN